MNNTPRYFFISFRFKVDFKIEDKYQSHLGYGWLYHRTNDFFTFEEVRDKIENLYEIQLGRVESIVTGWQEVTPNDSFILNGEIRQDYQIMFNN